MEREAQRGLARSAIVCTRIFVQDGLTGNQLPHRTRGTQDTGPKQLRKPTHAFNYGLPCVGSSCTSNSN